MSRTQESGWCRLLTKSGSKKKVPFDTLFVIFTNDLSDVVRSSVKIFAGDTKLFRALRTLEEKACLQQDLDNLVESSQKWQLDLDGPKCKILHLGREN